MSQVDCGISCCCVDIWWFRAFHAVVYICAMMDPNKLSFPEPAYKFNLIIISKDAV